MIIIAILILVLILLIINILLIFKLNQKDENGEEEFRKTLLVENKQNILEGMGAINTQLSNRLIELSEKQSKNNEDLVEKFGGLNVNLSREINDFKYKFKTDITEDFKKLTETIESKLTGINNKVEEKLVELSEKQSLNNEKLVESFGILNSNLSREINEFRNKFKDDLTTDFKGLTDTIENRLTGINNKVEERLNKGFENSNKTFNDIIQRLAKIDEAQKNIDKLSTEIVSLQDVLTDKKTRGIFGEVQLNQILESVFGNKRGEIYDIQYKMKEEAIVDAIIFAPEPLGMLPIDSKFPLENYQKMLDTNLPESERVTHRKSFVTNLKKHIDDISSKYVIANMSSQAVMFLPAEAIFAEVNAYHSSVIDYALSKKVWIASPTTLMAVLTTIQMVMIDAKRNEYSKRIHEELLKLGDEFDRYDKRWKSLEKDINKVNTDVKEISTTTNKINKGFDRIKNVKFENSGTEEIEGNILEIADESE